MQWLKKTGVFEQNVKLQESQGRCGCLATKDGTIRIMLFFYLPLCLATLSHAYQQDNLTPLEALSLHKQVL